MDFLILGIVVAIIAWIALRDRFGISHSAYTSKAAYALKELGLDVAQLSPELRQLYAHEREDLWKEKGRQANPHEMACSYYVKAVAQQPDLLEKIQAERALARAMVKVVSWRNEEVGAKFADLFALDLKLLMTDSNLLQKQTVDQA